MHPQRSLHLDGFAHRAPIPAAARIGPWLASSAISGIDPATQQPAESTEQQVHWVFQHLNALLEKANGELRHVLKVSVRITDSSVREPFNQAWLAAFPNPDDRPARHIEVSSLPEGLKLQMEIIAVIEQQGVSA